MLKCLLLRRHLKNIEYVVNKRSFSSPKFQTEYDIVVVGGINGASLVKSLTKISSYSCLFVTDIYKTIKPLQYFGGIIDDFEEKECISDPVIMIAQKPANCLPKTKVQKIHPEKSIIQISDIGDIKYKCLVLGVGLEVQPYKIKGIQEEEHKKLSERRVFVQSLDTIHRISDNQIMGTHHTFSNLVLYSPKFPYKGDGSDFYALYFKKIFDINQMNLRCSHKSKVIFVTPNKMIFKNPFANKFITKLLKERGIEIIYERELESIYRNNSDVSFMVLKNLIKNSNEELEFGTLILTPNCLPNNLITSSSLSSPNGLLSVNRFTLQHTKYENIFGFGDCIDIDTTKNQSAIMSQLPVVANNVINFFKGKEINGIYEGYSRQMVYLAPKRIISFSHKYKYIPTTFNCSVPIHGIFALLFNILYSFYAGFVSQQMFKNDKNYGPPFYKLKKTYPTIENNRFLKENKITKEEIQIFKPKVIAEEPKHHKDNILKTILPIFLKMIKSKPKEEKGTKGFVKSTKV